MEDGGKLLDHINSSSQLVGQLSSTDDKLKDEEQSLLLLTLITKSYKSLVQMIIVGRTTLKVEDVTTALQENGRMMQMEYVDGRD